MGDYWLDESKPTGPYEDDPWERWKSLGKQFTSISDGLILVGARMAKTFETTLGTSVREYLTIVEELETKTYAQIALEKADVSAAVPIGTHKKLFKEFGKLEKREVKRQIGRGNVAGHGPRGGTTFGRGGRRNY